MVSDANRLWHPEIPHSVPVAYGLKGYSMAASVIRNMCDRILQECYDYGLHIACIAFDGQWMPLANRGNAGQPLALLQL